MGTIEFKGNKKLFVSFEEKLKDQVYFSHSRVHNEELDWSIDLYKVSMFSEEDIDTFPYKFDEEWLKDLHCMNGLMKNNEVSVFLFFD